MGMRLIEMHALVVLNNCYKLLSLQNNIER